MRFAQKNSFDTRRVSKLDTSKKLQEDKVRIQLNIEHGIAFDFPFDHHRSRAETIAVDIAFPIARDIIYYPATFVNRYCSP